MSDKITANDDEQAVPADQQGDLDKLRAEGILVSGEGDSSALLRGIPGVHVPGALNRFLEEQRSAYRPADQELLRLYTAFHDHDEAEAWRAMDNRDPEHDDRFTQWLAQLMADDQAGRPGLADFEVQAIPALRKAWKDAKAALADASRANKPDPLPETEADFLLQPAQPTRAMVATIWPLTERAREYVTQQKKSPSDRIITGHHPSMRRVLEYEGFQVVGEAG